MSEYEIELAFDEFLDEVYGDVQIGAYSYATSSALKNVDPIAYRIGLSEFEDSLEEEEVN
jgi:hypothetical protein